MLTASADWFDKNLCCTCNVPVSLCRIYCRMRTNWPFKFVRVIIPGHSGNGNDNDNLFEQCFSHACNFGRSVRKFWTCSKIQCKPARIIFIPAYVHWKRVVIVFVAQLTCCILVVLTVYVIRACNISDELSANVTR